MLAVIHLYNPQIKGQEWKMLTHITLTHWILKNNRCTNRDKISEQAWIPRRRMNVCTSPSPQYQTNKSAQSEMVKQVPLDQSNYAPNMDKSESTLQPIPVSGNQRAPQITFFIGLPIFQHDPDNPP